jgi:hypothetical protein
MFVEALKFILEEYWRAQKLKSWEMRVTNEKLMQPREKNPGLSLQLIMRVKTCIQGQCLNGILWAGEPKP